MPLTQGIHKSGSSSTSRAPTLSLPSLQNKQNLVLVPLFPGATTRCYHWGGSPSHHRTPLWVEVVGPATTARPWCDANREAGGTRRATAARPRGDANWEFGPPSLVLMGGARRASRAWPPPLPWSLPYPLPLGGGRRLS
jgi:hypothetical protein